jgi:ABC-2 type transport system ATP-binding protein
MLSGLLFPTAGSARVLGHTPSKREKGYLRQIALIMGNRNQLAWDIPAMDSFDLNRAVYSIPPEQFRQTRDELIELLELGELVRKPVRNLSLGERMKMEIVGSLLHRPRVLFLDEPTIGLDVTMQRRLRRFIAEYNQRTGATVLLTSHYMADVAALCKRVIVIHHGQILHDGELSGLVERFSAFKTIGVVLEEPNGDLREYGEEIGRDGPKRFLRVPKADASKVAARLLNERQVADLTIEEPPIDEVIESVFAQEKAS